VNGWGVADGTPVILWSCHGGANQQWQYTAGRDLVNANSGKCLDITGVNAADGARLQVWSCAGGANQKWTVPA
jgi:glucosylceramidase